MRKHRSRFTFIPQLESTDCGPACLAMIARYYGKRFTVKEIKSLCSITRMGVSVQDIVDGSNKMGFRTFPLRLTLNDLKSSEIPLPVILFWKQDHFIVLYKIKIEKDHTTYYLADPGYGKIILDDDMTAREWMGANDKGIAIVLSPDGESSQQKMSGSVIRDFKCNLLLVKPVTDFARQNRKKYFLSLILLLLGLLTNWAMPVLFQKIIDQGIINKSLQVVIVLLVAQLGLFIGNFIADFISHWVLTKMNFRLSILLKENFLLKLMKLPISYFDTRLNTDTLQRLSDQSKIQSFVTWKGIELVLNLLNVTAFSIILFFISKAVFCIYLVASIFSILWITFFLKRRSILEYSLFLRQSENSNSLYEFIMHMPEIKVNHAQKTFIDKMLIAQKKLNDIELRSLFLNMYQVIGVNFLSKLKEILAIALCGYLIINGRMTFGSLLSISYILGQLAGPVQSFVGFIKDAQDANIAQQRVNDVYAEKNEIEGKKHQVPVSVSFICITNLVFKYPGSFNPFVLDSISFFIPANKITAIVGQSGSGKTTLLKLLLSYYLPTSGSISIDDLDLCNVHPEKWRKQCGIVMQDGHIFSGTIAENIALADTDINYVQVRKAATIACVDSFIEELPMQYHTKVGNTGLQLSGGQKQRLLIARALYRNPQYIFFDEATSSLDANNEKAIMNNLHEFFIGKTVIIIAHRLSTVKNADQIIVLEKGIIVQTGDHESLTKSKGKYFELVKNQLELGG